MVLGTEGRGPEFLYVPIPEKVIGTAKGSYSGNAPYADVQSSLVYVSVDLKGDRAVKATSAQSSKSWLGLQGHTKFSYGPIKFR